MTFVTFFKHEELKATLWAKRHLAAALTLCFALGLIFAGFWGMFENYQLRKVQQQLEISNTQHKLLLIQQAEMTLTTQRLKATNQALTESIRDQEFVNRDLERGLDFYRKLMDPAKVKEGLVLHNISITPLKSYATTNDSDVFRLHFTFVQYALQRRLMRAKLSFSIKGSVSGKEKTLAFKDIMVKSVGSSDELPLQSQLSFKFFQEFDQLIKIPDGFSPTSLIINATIKSKKKQRWAEHIPWPYAADNKIHSAPLPPVQH